MTPANGRLSIAATLGSVNGVVMGHKVYISFKTEDAAYKEFIQRELRVDMIDKSLDVPIASNDEDYILRAIRADYLSDSTVTVHLIGAYSAEALGNQEQRFIKRELQASLYDGPGNSRSGVLGVVLPEVNDAVYRGSYVCPQCGRSHNWVAIDDAVTVREFSYNYYLPSSKCAYEEDDRYCVLVPWNAFTIAPDAWIELAFSKRASPIAQKVRVFGL